MVVTNLSPEIIKKAYSLQGFAYRLTHNMPGVDPEDIIQEALVRIAGMTEPVEKIGYIGEVIKRIGIDEYRKRVRRNTHQEIDGIFDMLSSERELDPVRAAENNELGNILCEALEKLPECHRTTLYLRVVEGMGHSEIAREQDIPVDTVKSRLFHAREKLRLELSDKLKPYLGAA